MRFTILSAGLLLAVALVLIIAGCGGGEPVRGTVVELAHVPAHRANVEVEDYMLICLPTGGGMVSCFEEFVGTHWEEQAFEAQWNATLVRCRPDSTCEPHVLEITKEQYGRWSVGDYYPTFDEAGGIRSTA